MHFMRKKLIYIPFLSGLVLGILTTLIANSLRPLDNSGVAVLSQLMAIITLGLITGLVLKKEQKHPFLASIFALLYTYTLSIVVTVVTDFIHYGLSALITGFIAIGIFYFADKFFNRLKLNMAIKLLVAVFGFVVLFIVCGSLGSYLLRLTYTLFYQ